jgi:hypothetical protein
MSLRPLALTAAVQALAVEPATLGSEPSVADRSNYSAAKQ